MATTNTARIERSEVQTQIAVCIPTFRRPEGLCRLLAALSVQEPVPGCQITIVVVDNEGTLMSKAICDQFALKSRYPLTYCCELHRGLSHVRNRAVAVAKQFADALVFIDDDEVPTRGWLRHLVACQQAYAADAVCGPVIPHFMCEVPQWISTGRFFERPRYMTGTVLPEANTGNVLIRTEVFDRIGFFDDRFSLTGGEDMDFFVRLYESRGLISWADEAIVEEWVPTSRMTLKYVLQRAYRAASVTAYRPCLSHSRTRKLACVVRGVLRSMRGICLLLVSLARGRVEMVKALQRVSSGAGVIAGAFGLRYEQYHTVHSV
ncbi:MAG: glycosyltransferase family 2 protein [Acidobacteriia bacterium]|nr:glycosyltransferase family 2 protein [Terriglobia bacterium]